MRIEKNSRYIDLLAVNTNYIWTYKDSFLNWNETFDPPSIEELIISETMRLLRLERDRLLNETDWEVTRGIEEEIDITELKAYRSALRNLPQEIEAGNIEAPTLNENEELVFNSWPVRE